MPRKKEARKVVPIRPAVQYPLKLDIGGGKNKRDADFVSVDISGGDVTANMWELPYDDNVADMIWSSHTLEHVGIYKVNQTLKEWLRVLKPGCRAIISVPNFDYVAKYWLTGADRAWAEAMVFGHQADEGEFHKCAFTSASLRADLEAAGFEVKRIEVKNSHGQETLQSVCVKPHKIEG
jgi:predicted SAM-dependent methyltransferase